MIRMPRVLYIYLIRVFLLLCLNKHVVHLCWKFKFCLYTGWTRPTVMSQHMLIVEIRFSSVAVQVVQLSFSHVVHFIFILFLSRKLLQSTSVYLHFLSSTFNCKIKAWNCLEHITVMFQLQAVWTTAAVVLVCFIFQWHVVQRSLCAEN